MNFLWLNAHYIYNCCMCTPMGQKKMSTSGFDKKRYGSLQVALPSHSSCVFKKFEIFLASQKIPPQFLIAVKYYYNFSPTEIMFYIHQLLYTTYPADVTDNACCNLDFGVVAMATVYSFPTSPSFEFWLFIWKATHEKLAFGKWSRHHDLQLKSFCNLRAQQLSLLILLYEIPLECSWNEY